MLAVDDADPAADPEKIKEWQRKTKPPIVIDRYHFKQDRDGYLGQLRTHLALFDPVSRKAEALTTGVYSERLPSWSPDGMRIAFFSKRGADPDRTSQTTLFVMEANGEAVPTPIATVTTNNAARPSWSADGKWIALLKGDEPRMSAYHRYRIAIVPSTGGATRVLTEQLDRGVQAGFGWSRDSRHLTFAVDEDGASYLARVDVNNGKIDKLTTGRRTVSGVSVTARGDASFLGANAKTLPEVYVLNGATEQRVSSQNDGWLAEIKLGDTADFASKSKDGTEVRGLISTPPDYKKGSRYPTLLLIHGGPNGQDAHQLSALREVMTARGYVVMQVNYRGSSGRGDAFQKAIYADWGNKEVMDLIGAVDWAVAAGIADPARLGLGGWSYGGILTNYVIAQDTRFKAAVSGASSGNQISMFGTDQYILQYELELGPPWRSPDLWVKLSYPFFKADRIKTPTLFLSGELDFNVPTAGAEQMYQALKLTGVDTQLVIYPGQFHGITVPSYQRDVQQRFVGWFDKYLMPTTR